MKKIIVMITLIVMACLPVCASPVGQKDMKYNDFANKLLVDAVNRRDVDDVKKAFSLNANPLYTQGPGSSGSPFFTAITYGLNDIVQCFIDNNADVNYRMYNSSTGEWTPLFIAVLNRQYGMAEKLIESGAVVDKAMLNGDTVLFWAVRENGPTQINIVRLLISKNANVNKANNKGMTPLHIAAREGNTEAVEILLQNGAKIKVDNTGKTPVDYVKLANKELRDILL